MTGHDDPGELPPAPDDEAAALPVGLFGVGSSVGRIDPVPVLTLRGADITPSPSGTVPVALDDFTVTWGREETLDQPEPATAAVSLWTPDRTWAAKQDMIGKPLVLSWEATKPGVGLVRQTFFTGRVTGATVRRHTVANLDGTSTEGAIVDLSASSLLTDLANRIPNEAWPAETLGTRATRVAGWASPVASSVTVRTYWQAPQVAPIAAADQSSILDHLTALYAASGPDRLTFLPDTGAVKFVTRRDYLTGTVAQLWWDVTGSGTARAAKGAYIRTRGFGAAENGTAAAANYLWADNVEDADELSKDITSRITRIEVSHPDSGAAYADRTETFLTRDVPGAQTAADEALLGVRTARLDSIVAWNAYAQTAASDLGYMAAREGAGWKIPALTVRADLAGGFEYFDQFAALLLTGHEPQSPFFLAGSWLPQLDIRPVFSIMGGRITYRGGWQLECHLLPVTTGAVKQHGITWEEIDDGSSTYELRWYDDDNTRGLHESVTYEDMGYVGLGLAVGTLPTSTFDDFYIS